MVDTDVILFANRTPAHNTNNW